MPHGSPPELPEYLKNRPRGIKTIGELVDFKFARFGGDLSRLYFGPWRGDVD